ncbi:hypothetical protein HYX11_02325 [Candidatus Woesearchaeota archaeon]|nr:hypothetical protein [Candidatus Woesearchaeota archaeon]
MNSKGSSILMMIFEILIVLLTVYLITSIAYAYGSSTMVAKVNVAEEIRMMVDTLVGVPGEAIVEYPKNVSGFIFILDNAGIAVLEKGQAKNLWIIREFNLPNGYKTEGSTENEARVCLEKKEKKIILRKC